MSTTYPTTDCILHHNVTTSKAVCLSCIVGENEWLKNVRKLLEKRCHQLKAENLRLMAAAQKVISRHDNECLEQIPHHSTSIQELREATATPNPEA